MDERSWRLKIPGQPPSVNHLYKEATRTAKGSSGETLYWEDGRTKTYRTKVKNDGVQTYQDSVTWYAKARRPDKWHPDERLRLRYWFHLKRDIDCDNALKAMNDAIALALQVDDKTFLPTVEAKWTGEKDPFVIVEIRNEAQPEHDDSHHSSEKDAGH
jgi:Holliday junction resolvase RusA-like endonuclease